MPTPRHLYKYQSLSAYSLAALTNNTVWLAKPSTFNDPFDCALTLDRARFTDSLHHAVDVAVQRGLIQDPERPGLYDEQPGDLSAFESMRAKLLATLSNVGICCYSATSKHMLMWSHYANHHRGFCVEYSFSEGTQLRQLAEPVIYASQMPSISLADIAPGRREHAIALLWRTKAACWRYEREWRVLMSEGNMSYQAPAPVTSVIFGARMPEADRILVARALRHQDDIQFQEAVVEESRFAVVLRRR